MPQLSQPTSVKRMAEVHATLRRGHCPQSRSERSRSRRAMTAWTQNSRAVAARSRPPAGGAGRAQREPRRGCGGLACRSPSGQWTRRASALHQKDPFRTHAACCLKFPIGCANAHLAVQKCTLRQRADVAALLVISTGRRCGFYPAVNRSAIRSPPILRCPSLAYDQTKTQTKRARADSAQVCCRRFAESLVICTRAMLAKSAEVRTQELRWLCALCADRTQARHKPTVLVATW
jgi:hypothetical protein